MPPLTGIAVGTGITDGTIMDGATMAGTGITAGITIGAGGGAEAVANSRIPSAGLMVQGR